MGLLFEEVQLHAPQLVAWLVKMRDMYKDEVGLHIHPYCNFVESAGLPCVTDQSTVYAEDLTGYTIKLSAYSRADMGTLLDHANALFVQTFSTGGVAADRPYYASVFCP